MIPYEECTCLMNKFVQTYQWICYFYTLTFVHQNANQFNTLQQSWVLDPKTTEKRPLKKNINTTACLMLASNFTILPGLILTFQMHHLVLNCLIITFTNKESKEKQTGNIFLKKMFSKKISPKVFLKFSRGIERHHRAVMG